MTTEQFMDHLSSQTSPSLRQLRHLSVKAYPFPLYHTSESFYTTHSITDVFPLFPGLQLSLLEIEDAFHGPEVAEDGWGHNAAYNTLKYLIQKGMGWRELRYRSASDRWLEPVTFQCRSRDNVETTETHARDEQPKTWDRWIKERDGDSDGARAELWVKEAGEGNDWKRFEGEYVSPSVARIVDGYTEENRPAVEVRIRRGSQADYVQRGPEHFKGDDEKFMQKLHALFKSMTWWEIKEKGLFMAGAEDDPTAHL